MPGGRTDVHLLRDPGRAQRDLGGAGGAAAGRTPPDRVIRRTLLGTSFGGGLRGGRRVGGAGTGAAYGRGDRGVVRDRPPGRHRARLSAVGQPRGGDRAAGGGGGRGVPGGGGAAAGGRGAVAGLGAGRG